MRTLVEPPPTSRCDLCGGELRLKLIEPANRELDLEDEILVCVNCGHEQSNIVKHNHNMPHTRRPSQRICPPSPDHVDPLNLAAAKERDAMTAITKAGASAAEEAQ